MPRNTTDFYGKCDDCGGTGTEVVSDGETAFSGDDDCPTCKGTGKGVR
jgi:DnaJ-class molecular chaperone